MAGSKRSPYADTPVTDYYMDPMVNRNIPMQEDDVLFKITQTYHLRPDLLAYDLYESSELWWVFAGRNPDKLRNPLGDFEQGTDIYLPKIELLREVLGF